MQAFSDPRELRSYLPDKDLFTQYRVVLGDGSPKPDVVVIVYQPNGWDATANRLLMGKHGIPIREHLFSRGVDFYATSVFPFFRGQDKAKAVDVRQAAPIVAEELRRVPAERYLILGADAARFCPLFDYPFKRFDEIVGRTFEIDGKRFRVAHAPAAITSNPTIFAQFAQALDELLVPPKPRTDNVPDTEHYQVLTNRMQAKRLLERMPTLVACDIESTGLDPWTDRILTIQLSWEPGTGYAFPWDLFTPEEWGGYLGGKHLVFQNGTFDTKFLATHGVYVQAHADTMLLHSLVDETPGTHSMEQMAVRFLGIEKWGDTVDYDDMEGNSLRTLGRYGARDTDITLRLYHHFKPLTENRHITRVLQRAQNAITRSELRGIRVDRDKAQQFADEIERALHDRKEHLADSYGLANANSPKQVAKLLIEDMGIPLPKVKGKVSTASGVIAPFATDHSVIRDILEYRHLTKAGSTYVANILAASQRDGRYHPEFRLAATETGRVAEKLITLIPRPDDLDNPDLGKQYQVRLRELFIPDPGYVMIGADYRGLEVGMGAYITQDPQLIEDYNTQLDTHSVVAVQAFELDIPLEPRETLKKRVQKSHAYERELAKRATFTWLYGGTESAIANQLNISKDLAARILVTLRERYQGVARWQQEVQAHVQEHGGISTPWGRARRFSFLAGMDQRLVEEQLREAINAPNQGMASDINLAAFAELEAAGIKTLFPFHDAIYVQAPQAQAERVAKTVKQTMESVLQGPVKFEAEVKTGPNWAELG